MIIELELFGNLTVMNVEVTGYFTQYTEATYWQPSEGGYFEIEKIERNGRDVTKLLDNLKGNKRLLEDIANNIEENYND
jgi:hypothetical protein